jgi:hypothetical protein
VITAYRPQLTRAEGETKRGPAFPSWTSADRWARSQFSPGPGDILQLLVSQLTVQEVRRINAEFPGVWTGFEPLGTRWRVTSTGNLYEVTGVDSCCRYQLTARELSEETIRELREFATDNRLDPDAQVERYRTMEVDAQWFNRGDLRLERAAPALEGA